ncbi:MAG: hypothetical protein ACFFEN_07640 [Candidatus Thorarchaeota archaeon]
MGRKKGFKFEEARIEAINAGLLDQTLTEVFFSKYERNKSLTPDIFYPTLFYVKKADKDQFYYGEQRKGRERHYNYVSPSLKLYIEVFDIPIKTVGFGRTPHAFDVKIYCDNQQTTLEVALLPKTLYKKKDLVEETDWEGVERIFNVNREDCIKFWETL